MHLFSAFPSLPAVSIHLDAEAILRDSAGQAKASTAEETNSAGAGGLHPPSYRSPPPRAIQPAEAAQLTTSQNLDQFSSAQGYKKLISSRT